jgi:hypothetical protein
VDGGCCAHSVVKARVRAGGSIVQGSSPSIAALDNGGYVNRRCPPVRIAYIVKPVAAVNVIWPCHCVSAQKIVIRCKFCSLGIYLTSSNVGFFAGIRLG